MSNFRNRSRSPVSRINQLEIVQTSEFHRENEICTMAVSSLEISMAKDMLPDYSGGSRNLAYFIKQADSYINLLKRPEENCLFNKLLFEQVKSKIIGEARDVLISSKCATWSEIKDTLLNKFGDPRSEDLLANDLATCFQLTNETYEQYYERIKVKLQTLLEHISIREINNDIKISKTNMYTNNALSTFKAGVAEPYCSLMINLHIDTLEQALFQCRKYDNDKSQIGFMNFLRNKGKNTHSSPMNHIKGKYPMKNPAHNMPPQRHHSYISNYDNSQNIPKFPTGPVNIQPRPAPQQKFFTNEQVFGKKPEPKPTPMSVCTRLTNKMQSNKPQNFNRNFFKVGPKPTNYAVEEVYNAEIENDVEEVDSEYYEEDSEENFREQASENPQLE